MVFISFELYMNFGYVKRLVRDNTLVIANRNNENGSLITNSLCNLVLPLLITDHLFHSAFNYITFTLMVTTAI